MAFATANSPANRKPGDNTQTTTPPQAQARPRQSPGKTEPQRARPPRVQEPRARQTPPARIRPHQRAPGPERARTSAARARPPTHARTSAAHDRPPIARQTPARARTKTWWVRCRPCSGESNPPSHARSPRAPGRKPGSGALAGPSSGLRGANRAEQRVPRALAGPSSELPLRRIANFVQPWSKETILRRLRAKTHDSSRYRKPIREQPAKSSISHFRYREKPSVLTASDQNRRFFASRTLHDSPFPCSTSSTPVIDLGDGRLLSQA